MMVPTEPTLCLLEIRTSATNILAEPPLKTLISPARPIVGFTVAVSDVWHNCRRVPRRSSFCLITQTAFPHPLPEGHFDSHSYPHTRAAAGLASGRGSVHNHILTISKVLFRHSSSKLTHECSPVCYYRLHQMFHVFIASADDPLPCGNHRCLTYRGPFRRNSDGTLAIV